MIQNLFEDGNFNFQNLGTVTGAATCTEGYGNDKHDQGVRWSDIDGDGMLYEVLFLLNTWYYHLLPAELLTSALQVEPIFYVCKLTESPLVI